MGWPLDPKALVQLGVSHGVQGRLTASISGGPFSVPVELVSGSVRIDGDAAARRTLTCTVRADISSPAVSSLTAQMRAEYGITSPNGTTYWTPVFTGPVRQSREGGRRGTVQLTAVDRMLRVQEARFEGPAVTSGLTRTAIQTLVQDVGGLTLDISSNLAGTHGSSLWEKDRDKAVLDLARSIGGLVVFDPMGNGRLIAQPTLTGPVFWQINAGLGGVKISASRGHSRDRTYNAVVAIGEPENAAPVYARAIDNNPASPTFYGGPFGKRPRFYRSPLLTTTGQAAAAAGSLLARTLGVARTLELQVLPHPGLDAGDVVLVEVAPLVYERHLVDSFTLPLGRGTVDLQTRTVAEPEGE